MKQTLKLSGIEMFFALLIADGSACPKCGHGTRKTSANWRRCKKCGERIHLVPATDENKAAYVQKLQEYTNERDGFVMSDPREKTSMQVKQEEGTVAFNELNS